MQKKKALVISKVQKFCELVLNIQCILQSLDKMQEQSGVPVFSPKEVFLSLGYQVMMPLICSLFSPMNLAFLIAQWPSFTRKGGKWP